MNESMLKTLEEAYEIMGDGQMAGCLGKVCPSTCCVSKTAECIGGELVTGKARLLGKPEIYYQDQIFTPSIQDLDVRINVGLIRGSDHSHLIYLLDNCQNSDGSCKLQSRKPLRCRMFPFSLNPAHPIDSGCLKIEEICSDPALIEKITRVRKLLGVD